MFPPCSMPSLPTIYSLSWRLCRLPPPLGLTITHNFRELRERPKGQVVANKKGAADNKL